MTYDTRPLSTTAFHVGWLIAILSVLSPALPDWLLSHNTVGFLNYMPEWAFSGLTGIAGLMVVSPGAGLRRIVQNLAGMGGCGVWVLICVWGAIDGSGLQFVSIPGCLIWLTFASQLANDCLNPIYHVKGTEFRPWPRELIRFPTSS